MSEPSTTVVQFTADPNALFSGLLLTVIKQQVYIIQLEMREAAMRESGRTLTDEEWSRASDEVHRRAVREVAASFSEPLRSQVAAMEDAAAAGLTR